MKYFFSTLLCCAFSMMLFAQQPKSIEEEKKINSTIKNFLKWYKANGDDIMSSPIIRGLNEDTIKKDSIVKIDMNSVDEYLANFKKSTYVSDSFLGDLRCKYKDVADSLQKEELRDYFGPIPGLECDLLFGFEPEEILDHIDNGKLSKSYFIYNKALVKFEISKFYQMIFTLTKIDNGTWLIDSLGYDRTNIDKVLNRK